MAELGTGTAWTCSPGPCCAPGSALPRGFRQPSIESLQMSPRDPPAVPLNQQSSRCVVGETTPLSVLASFVVGALFCSTSVCLFSCQYQAVRMAVALRSRLCQVA